MASASSLHPPRTSDAASWAMLSGLAVSLLLVQLRAPLAIEPAGLLKLVVASITLAGAAIFYSRYRPRPAFAAMCVGLIQVLLFSALAALLSYALAREGGALWDSRLAGWDKALGFDWLAYVRWVDSKAWLAATYRAAYASLIPQVIVIVLVLGFTGRVALMRAVLLAAMISGTAIVMLSSLFPAVSNFVHLGLSAADFDHVDPFAGYSHLSHYQALRSGMPLTIRLPEMQGIITFPSYHAGLATVTFWGFWRSGLLPMRAVGCTTAALTILATPVDGGHYLVDVLAGCAIGFLSIAIAERAVRWAPALSLTASPFRRSRAASVR
ncbi:phosphatase PAP2 family protein [Sphingomonas sp. GCM10030256]|uniref:phosphatase PAP2 family protein n=1 Tax=Sphingomonas sp. GCM10030256 TaxID=3273427 RepID=UPI003611E43F